MNIVFCTDNNYLMHLASAIESILAHHSSGTVRFYIVVNNCTLWDLEIFASVISTQLITFIEDTSLDERPLFTNRHISKATYQRLFLDYLLPEKIDRFLYLDCDVVVTGNLNELYQLELEEFFIAAAPEYDARLLFDKSRKPTYFNAGVMLVNRKLWRREGISEFLEHLVLTERETLTFWDQDALNAVLMGKWLPISNKWNVTALYFRNKRMMRKNRTEDVYSDTRIVHFNASLKPWHYRLRHPYKSTYFKYLPEPYRAKFKYSDKNLLTMARKVVGIFLVTLGIKEY